jgi:hypothetical protein
VIGEALAGNWRAFGLPAFAQFHNDSRFLGGHGQPDLLGPVPRLCLALGVTPVFAPIRETGFQAAIESFNGLWQARVWRRAFCFGRPELALLLDLVVPTAGTSVGWHLVAGVALTLAAALLAIGRRS